MTVKDFIRTTADFFDAQLRKIARQLANGQIRASSSDYAFPTMLRIVETPYHFIAELCGSRNPLRPTDVHLLRPSHAEQFKDASSFFNGGFDVGDGKKGGLTIQTVGCTLANLTLATPYDRDIFLAKIDFPLHESVLKTPKSEVPLAIRSTADRLLINEIDVVRADDVRVLYRMIGTAICILKETTASTLRDWLESIFAREFASGIVLGMNHRHSESAEAFAQELCSLADQDVSETTIDRFIQTHGKLFADALGYKKVISQSSLRWIDRDSDDPEFSQPDYLLERSDGFWDILDLKRALLRFRSIVLGLPYRPRFVAYVTELISQLDRYQSYFEKPRNAEWAENKHGVRVYHPRLVGVVGNYDTFVPEHVSLAMRPYRENILVLSYSDIVSLLRARHREAMPA